MEPMPADTSPPSSPGLECVSILDHSADGSRVEVVRLPGGGEGTLRRRPAGDSQLVREARSLRSRRELDALYSLPFLGVPEPIAHVCDGSSVGTLVEYRAGKSLWELCDADRLRALRSATDLIARVHRAGWVHGDLKPDHILWDCAAEQVSIIDWEHAARVGDRAEPGTAGYAPDQAWRSGFRADPLTDTYALIATVAATMGPTANTSQDWGPRTREDLERSLGSLPEDLASDLRVGYELGQLPCSANVIVDARRARSWIARELLVLHRFDHSEAAVAACSTAAPATFVETSSDAIGEAVAHALSSQAMGLFVAASTLGLSERSLRAASLSERLRDEIARRARAACRLIDALGGGTLVVVSSPNDGRASGIARITKAMARAFPRVRCLDVIPRTCAADPAIRDRLADRIRDTLSLRPVDSQLASLRRDDGEVHTDTSIVASVCRSVAVGSTPHAEKPHGAGLDGLSGLISAIQWQLTMGETDDARRSLARATSVAVHLHIRDSDLWFELGDAGIELGLDAAARASMRVAYMLGSTPAFDALVRLAYAEGSFSRVVAMVSRQALAGESSVERRSWLNLSLARATPLLTVWRMQRRLLVLARSGRAGSLATVLRHTAVLARYRGRHYTAKRLVLRALTIVRQRGVVRSEMELQAALELSKNDDVPPREAARRWEGHRDQCLELGLRDVALHAAVRAARSWVVAGDYEMARFALDSAGGISSATNGYWRHEVERLVQATEWQRGVWSAGLGGCAHEEPVSSGTTGWRRIIHLELVSITGSLRGTPIRDYLGSQGWIGRGEVCWESAIALLAMGADRQIEAQLCLLPFILRLSVHAALRAGVSVEALVNRVSEGRVWCRWVVRAVALYYTQGPYSVEMSLSEVRPPGVMPWEWHALRGMAILGDGASRDAEVEFDSSIRAAIVFSASLAEAPARRFAELWSNVFVGPLSDATVSVPDRASELTLEALRVRLRRLSGARSLDLVRLGEVCQSVARAATRSRSVVGFLGAILPLVAEEIRAQAGCVVDPSGVVLRSMPSDPASPGAAMPIVSALLLARARKSSEPLLLADALSDEEARSRRSVRAGGARTILMLPVAVEGDWWCLYFTLASAGREAGEQAFRVSRALTPVVNLGASSARSRRDEERLQTTIDEIRTERARDVQLVEIGRTAGAMSHELNNLLAVIGGEAEYLAERLGLGCDDAMGDSLASIAKAASDGGRLVRAALDAARLEGGQRDAAVCMYTTIQQVKRDFAATHPQLLLRVSCPAGATVRGNPLEIREVLVNIVRNAADANGGAGRVQLHLSLDGGWCIVCVTDEGPGFSALDLERAFDSFYTTKGEAGNGLGLAIVRKLVAAHGGEVSLRNTDSGGEVEIILPKFVERPSRVLREADYHCGSH